jgi:riboflavin kinase/FMN adenylyltransferase
VVVEGDRRGRTIGIPTANLSIPPELAVPARGVYAAWADHQGGRAPAVVNIGLRPTFDGASDLTVEAHLLDYEGDLYGRSLRLHFVERLRDEQKFNGVSALVRQIQHDIQQARILLQERTG